jgi:hypothetical protein
MLKKYFANPSFFFLLAGNLYCIWYYQNHTNGFITVVWIYWLQSVIIGLFNFIDLLTIKNYDAGNFKLNDAPVTEKNKGCMAWFFLLHYGGFHLGYALFLLVDFGVRDVDKIFLLIGVAAFLMETISGFIKNKQFEQQVKLSIGTMFFLPYLRILPMHLMILIPAFTGIKASLIFLVLKMAADILSYMLYRFIFSKNNEAVIK